MDAPGVDGLIFINTDLDLIPGCHVIVQSRSYYLPEKNVL